MENKICEKCKLNLPISDFNKHCKTKDGLQCYCKSCKRKYRTDPDKKLIYNNHLRAYYHKRRNLAISLFGNKCLKCLETDPIVFQFDHIIPEGKNKKTGSALINEVINNPSKFQMLCANCHVRKTALNKEYYNPVRESL